MVKVNISKLLSSDTGEAKIHVASKCEKYLQPFQKRKKKVDLDAIGNQQNNNLLDFLHCQTRADSDTRMSCTDVQKMYNKCHSSVMGTGSYGAGKKHCGEELEVFLSCVVTTRNKT